MREAVLTAAWITVSNVTDAFVIRLLLSSLSKKHVGNFYVAAFSVPSLLWYVPCWGELDETAGAAKVQNAISIGGKICYFFSHPQTKVQYFPRRF